jgi:hypothetical protein
LTGMIDQTSAQKLGKLLGVDAIASGTVTDLGKTLRVNARLVDTGTGEIFAVAAAEIAKDESVLRLLGGGDGSVSGSEPAARKPASQKIDMQFFTFELQQCRISGSAVICDLTVTNNDRDRELGIMIDGTGLIDDANNTVMVKALEDVRRANATGSFMSGKAATMMIAGVPTQLRIVIKEVSPQAKRISLFGIHCDAGGEFRVRFRDVQLVGTGH